MAIELKNRKTFTLPIDYTAQPTEQTLREIYELALAAGAPVNETNSGARVEHVRDAATGKLVQVKLSLPDTAAQSAADAIARNPGIITVDTGPVAIPAQLVSGDLNPSAPDGIVFTGTVSWNHLFVLTNPPTSAGVVIGSLNSAGVYADGSIATPAGVRIALSVTFGGPQTINSGELTLNLYTSAGAEAVPIILNSPLVVGNLTNTHYFVSEAGNLFLQDVSSGGDASYEAAVTANPLGL